MVNSHRLSRAVVAQSLAMLFFLLPVGISLSADAGKGNPITQEEWARMLGAGMGLKEMPAGASPGEYMSTLSQREHEQIEGEDFKKASPGVSVQSFPDTGGAGNGKYAVTTGKPGQVRYTVTVPLQREYVLRARIRGKDAQFWTVDQKESRLVRPTPDFEWHTIGRYTLKKGEHTISVSLPEGSGIDVLELVAGSAPGRATAQGTGSEDPLNYGFKATSVVEASDMQGELPIDEGFFRVIEAERAGNMVGKFEISEDEKHGRPSERRWLRPLEGGTTARYTFEVPEDGMYSVTARVFGPSQEIWKIDGGRGDMVKFRPLSHKKFGWYPVTTLYLAKGTHTIGSELRKGSGSDVIVLQRRRSTGGDYLQLLSDLGFTEGGLPGRDKTEGKRRYDQYLNIGPDKFKVVKGELDVTTGTDDYGKAAGGKWLKPRGGPATAVCEIDVKEEGMYSIYVRVAGDTPQTWTIDGTGDGGGRDRRQVFPLSDEGFAWQELVSLELTPGKHTLQVEMGPGSGLDMVGVRKRSLSTAELEREAERPVGRDDAWHNIHGVIPALLAVRYSGLGDAPTGSFRKPEALPTSIPIPPKPTPCSPSGLSDEEAP